MQAQMTSLIFRTKNAFGGILRHSALRKLEWASEHRAELMEDWDLCARMQTPNKIEPLK